MSEDAQTRNNDRGSLTTVSFTRPPVIETVLGVQFEPIAELTNARLGVFWKGLGPEWPKHQEAQPLELQFESFDLDGAWIPHGIRIKVTQNPASRLQIFNGSGDRMIQVQNGRLHYNWLASPTKEYPRYRKIRPEFDRVLEAFVDFLEKESLGTFKPNQWEVTYVNHFPKGTVWSDLSDSFQVFKTSALPEPSGMALEGLSCQWHFLIPPRRGRLHVDIQHGRATSREQPEIIRMQLTARGSAGEQPDGPSLTEGLDCGHESIVRGFFDLTSDQAHRFWGFNANA